jgi:hypothetical protein
MAARGDWARLRPAERSRVGEGGAGRQSLWRAGHGRQHVGGDEESLGNEWREILTTAIHTG